MMTIIKTHCANNDIITCRKGHIWYHKTKDVYTQNAYNLEHLHASYVLGSDPEKKKRMQ